MVLIVKPIEANLTKDKDNFGKSDPYCVVIIGQQKQRTKTHSGAGKYPKWMETLQFQNGPNDTLMKVQVWDEDFGKDDLIGQGTYNLTQLYSMPNRTENQYVDIVYHGKSSGRVLISLEYQGPPMGGNQGQGGWGNQGWGNGPQQQGWNQPPQQGGGWGNQPGYNQPPPQQGGWGNQPGYNQPPQQGGGWGNGPQQGWGNQPPQQGGGWGNQPPQQGGGWGNPNQPGWNNNQGGYGPNNGW